MAEFVRCEDWGLQAIVRGSSSSSSSITCGFADPDSCFMENMAKDSLVFGFPGLFDGAASMLTDELEELYKPFYSPVSSFNSLSSQNSSPAADPTTPSSFSFISKEVKEETDQEVCEKVDKSSPAATTITPYVPKYKKRKNQHKRVVLQVTAEELTSDKWAWRKYGQKPIKGSPYPRSYYRCSSSKGCLARKQVEQSCTDPGIFIITYTAEHSHSQPTRRNALAGTIRTKFGSNPKSPTGSLITGSKSSKTAPCLEDLSPGTPRLVAEIEESVGTQMMITDHELMIGNKNGTMLPEFVFDDEFFSCFNDLDGFMSELGDGHCSTGTDFSSESDFL